MTRTLAKGLASLQLSLLTFVDSFPQTLFRVIWEPEHAGAVLNKPPCLRDQVSLVVASFR